MRNRIYFAITLAGALCALPAKLAAQTGTGAVYAGGPMQIGASDHAVVCAMNLGTTSLSVSLELVDAMTGATLLQQSATLAAPGTAGGGAAGACLDSATASRAIIGILIGRVAVNPQPLPPHTVTLVGSLEASSMGTSGPLNARIVALEPLHPPQPCILVQ